MISVRFMYEPASLSIQRLAKKNFKKIHNDITAVTEKVSLERERASIEELTTNVCA